VILFAIAVAFSGEMYLGAGQGPPGTFDGRELVFVPNQFLIPWTFVWHDSLSFNRSENALYSCFLWSDALNPDEERLARWERDGTYQEFRPCPYAVLGVYNNAPYFNPLTNTLADSGQYYPREWIDPLGMAVGWNGAGLEGIRADGSVVPINSAEVLRHMVAVTALAWDGDTHLIWVFGWLPNIQVAIALDPSSGRVVADAWDLAPAVYATGYYDTHPEQTPELLVTGQCPGTVYVTLVDGTPGGRAYVAAGTVAGPSVLPAGVCGDVELGLTDPVRRATLPINSFGIASTTFQATPDQCGARLLQALDMRTCAPTQVRTVPPTLP